MAAQSQERVRKRLVWFSPFFLVVALSPAFLQITCDRGDTHLSNLQVEVSGHDQIVGFAPATRYYDVATSGDTVVVRAETRDATSSSYYQLRAGGALIEAGALGVGGGEVTLSIPLGQSTLKIDVRPTQGGFGAYSIDVVRFPEFPCTEQGILDAIAFGGGPHTFACNGPTTVTTLDEIFIYNDVILDGGGNLTVQGSTYPPSQPFAGWHRVFSVDAGVTVELIGMTLTAYVEGSGTFYGGGIFNEGTLTLRNSNVVDNIVWPDVGGCRGAGIYSTGVLSVSSSNIEGNSCDGDGGGIYSTGVAFIDDSVIADNFAYPYAGAGMYNTGELTALDSKIEWNSAGYAAGICNLGGTLTVRNSTVSGNVGDADGYLGNSVYSDGIAIFESSSVSGRYSSGAPEMSFHGATTLVNATVFGDFGAINGSGTMTLSSSTIVADTYEWTGPDDGVISFNGDLHVRNSIIVDANPSDVAPACAFPIISEGYNIESNGNSCGFTDPTDLVNVTAAELNLGPLADNGGPTETHALLPGCVAIDRIPEALCVDADGLPLTADQRGIARPQDGACDAGAFEWADCSGSACDDGSDCTTDYCDAPDYSWCVNNAVPDGMSCDFGGLAGTCFSGTCDPSLFPCTEQGILDAIARGGGPYTFACNGPTTVVTQAEIVIDNDVVLDGEGNLTIDGNDDHLVIRMVTGVEAELRGFTVSGGAPGGIGNGGTMTLTNSTVSGNQGTGIGNGGALTLISSRVSDNTTNGNGGGIHNSGGTLTLINSTVSDNTSFGAGGGIANYNAGTLTLTNSTVSGNTTAFGAGIYNDAGTVTLTNSTVSGNTAYYYLGGGNGGGILNDYGTLTLTNSTVSGNTSDNRIDGVSNTGGISSGTLTLTNTLIDDDCGGTITSGGGNLESPGNTCGFDQPTDQVSVPDPMLGPLQNNGGPTMTHALLPGSDAIDQIPVVDCQVTEDQRGEPRPGGAMCDVGAFEVQP